MSDDLFDAAGDYQPGERVPGPGYIVRRVIGRGGHATVYEVENGIGKVFVLKVIQRHHAKRADLVERMVVEARALARLRHPNIVDVYNAGQTTGDRPLAYIEMELLEGGNGRQLLEMKRRLEVPHALDVLIDVCNALDVAHRAGVVHQDLKPDNIFIHVDQWAHKAVTKLLDFGVARILGGEQRAGILEGTIAYAAPEQLRGEEVTARTDLYALGVIAFELLTGRRPFADAEALDVADPQGVSSLGVDSSGGGPACRWLVNAKLTQRAPDLCDFALVPRDLEQVISELLEREASKRPESAHEVGKRLRALRVNPALAKSPMTTQDLLLDAVGSGVGKGATLRMNTVQASPAEALPGGVRPAAGAAAAAVPAGQAFVAAGFGQRVSSRPGSTPPPQHTDPLPRAPVIREAPFAEPMQFERPAAQTATPIVPTLEPVVDRQSKAALTTFTPVRPRRFVAAMGLGALLTVAVAGVVGYRVRVLPSLQGSGAAPSEAEGVQDSRGVPRAATPLPSDSLTATKASELAAPVQAAPMRLEDTKPVAPMASASPRAPSFTTRRESSERATRDDGGRAGARTKKAAASSAGTPAPAASGKPKDEVDGWLEKTGRPASGL